MTITRRTITEAEFIKRKEHYPFDMLRQDSKTINFGLIFGMSYRKFSSNDLEPKWSMERVDNFIEEKKLHSVVLKMEQRHERDNIDPKLYKYYAVASYIREQFFETYPGLAYRIKRNEEFAKEHGYIRSFYGAIRRLPLLSLAFDAEGKVRKDEDKREVANWVNITANSTIQTDEAVTIMTNINEWEDEHSVIIGTVHDSCDFYVEKEHALEVFLKMKAHFERKNPEFQGELSFPVDIMYVDFLKEGEYYKKGTKFKGRIS